MTDAELSAAVAQRVLGWTRIGAWWEPPSVLLARPLVENPPPFATDIGACFRQRLTTLLAVLQSTCGAKPEMHERICSRLGWKTLRERETAATAKPFNVWRYRPRR